MAGAEAGGVGTAPLERTRSLIAELRKVERRADIRSLAGTKTALELVHRISDILNEFFHDFDGAMARVIDVVLEVTGAMRGALVLLDEADRPEVAVARSAEGADLDPESFRIPDAVLERVLRRGEAVFLSDLAEDTVENGSGEFRITSALCAPLTFAPHADPLDLEDRRQRDAGPRRILGLIYLDSESISSPLSREGLYFLEAIANHATAALRNARIYLQATRDSLTGLSIRRVFENRLPEEIRNAARTGQPLSLLMTDLDHFKSVNDVYGHPVGDEVLTRAAEAARQCVRSTDLVARYGGEEFALLLPRTWAGEAFAIAEKIRGSVGDLRFAEGRGRITLSVGVAEYPAHAEDAEELVRHADKALYHAKARGRNRTVVWSPSIGRQAGREDKLAGILTGDWARDYRNVSLLLETLDRIHSAEDLAGAVRIVVEKTVEITDADRGLLLLGDRPGELEVHLGLDKAGNRLPSTVRYSSSVVQRVYEEREPLAIVDTVDDLRGVPTPDSVRNLEIRSMMCAPLKDRRRLFGAIYVDSRRRAQGFLPADLSFFNALATQAAGVLARRI